MSDKICQIKETCIYVEDLSKTLDFYNSKLGLAVIAKSENRHVFFRAGTSVLLCFLPEVTKNETTLPPHFAKGNIHLAFEVEKEDYKEWKNKVRNAGIEIIQEYSWPRGLESFYFRDPDGNLLEIVPKGLWD